MQPDCLGDPQAALYRRLLASGVSYEGDHRRRRASAGSPRRSCCMRAASTARFSSRPTACASSASASTRCRTRSRSWRSSGCSRQLDAGRDPHLRALLYEPHRPGDLARAARHSMPASNIRNSRSIAAVCRRVIYQAARARLGESRIHTGHRLGSFTQDEGGVTAYFFDRDGSHRTTARGDMLIGADGIHSHRARDALSERRPGALERLDALARRDRLAEISDRTLDGDRRRHGRQAGRLSDRRRRPRGQAAHQLGGAGEGRRRRRAAAARKTGRAPAASKI